MFWRQLLRILVEAVQCILCGGERLGAVLRGCLAKDNCHGEPKRSASLVF